MSHLSAPAVQVRALERRFGPRCALKGVDLSVAAGEIHGLLGPAGAGKSTLLRVLAGHIEPSAGRARVLGQDLATGVRTLRARVGLIAAADLAPYQRISGTDNLAFYARMDGMETREAVIRARTVLEEVGLGHAADWPVAEWSRGMQQRLPVAKALLTDPDVLLIDEATRDMSPGAAAGVRTLVAARARRGAAVMWATRRLDDLCGFADSVTLLAAGRVRYTGSVDALAARALAGSAAVRQAA